MKNFEKHKKYIHEKLVSTYPEIETTRIRKMPNGVKYLTWSVGAEVETDYSYKLYCKTKDGEQTIIFCHIVTFLSLFILQSLFFEQTVDNYKRIYPEKQN